MTSPAASPFAYADFKRLQIARVAAIVATQAQGTAVAWDVLERTHRPLDLGYVGLAQFAPIAGLSLLAGHVVDRVERKRLLAMVYAVYAAAAAALFAYAMSGARAIFPIYAILFCDAIARSFGQPAGSALLPEIVPADVFERAVAWSSSLWQVATIVGPIVGGVLVAAFGASYAYALACVLSLASAASIVRIEQKPTRSSDRGVSFVSLLAGVRYVWSHQLILGSISLDLFAVLLGGATALLPVFADLLHTGSWGLGLLRAAPGVGAALSGIWLAYRPLKRRAGLWMFACVAGFGLATIGFAESRNFVISLALLFVCGATDMVSVVVRQTLLQIETPNDMRGRVSAVNLVFVGASNELGEFESGLTGQWWGARTATLVGGIGTLVVVGLGMLVFPKLRDVDSLKANS
ncbi:MAG TPA: MFS transporter [Polyangiaceae bacterium]|jgi:MFS family permease